MASYDDSASNEQHQPGEADVARHVINMHAL